MPTLGTQIPLEPKKGLVVWLPDGLSRITCKRCGKKYKVEQTIPCRCGEVNTWTHKQLKTRPVFILTNLISHSNESYVYGAPITTNEKLRGHIYAVEVPANSIAFPAVAQREASGYSNISQTPTYILVHKIGSYEWKDVNAMHLGSRGLEEGILNSVEAKIRTLMGL